jgi:predicted metal-dependent enzyme (double-stranded beta helix superfamily)
VAGQVLTDGPMNLQTGRRLLWGGVIESTVSMDRALADPLARFVANFEKVADHPEKQIVASGSVLLADLVATDDWLATEHRQADPTRYQQYLLYRDPAVRFCVVSFVWGPGQSTPVHDHCTWGLIGVLIGAESITRFGVGPDGLVQEGPEERRTRGEVDAVSPRIGDIHRVANAVADASSISIHVYGGDIGTTRRHTYQSDGTTKPFVSGYSSAARKDPLSTT